MQRHDRFKGPIELEGQDRIGRSTELDQVEGTKRVAPEARADCTK
jgi:hypothetical protein